MSNYVVSARKYRPSRFDEVVGQGHVSQTLKNALKSDHLAHAFLFCGPRGVGKTTCARILAKVLNCENHTEDFEACNTCDSCQAFNENTSFNITELDAASNNSVEHIRALIEQVRFQPQKGQYKIFIIDEVHMLSQQAFNAFLKTLEEPPPYAIFILATTEKHKIIPTILSRCQIFDFKRIQIPDMVQHLSHICETEGIEAEPEALHIIAQKADGALRDSLSIFDRIVAFSNQQITYSDVITNLNILDYDYYFQMVNHLLQENVNEVLLLLDQIMRKGFDGDLFINGLAEHLRNLLVCKDEKSLQLLEAGEKLKERYLSQAILSSSSFIVSALNIANECDVEYKMARNKRLHVEMALIKMTFIMRSLTATPLQTIAQAPVVEQQKKTPELTKVSTLPTKEPEIKVVAQEKTIEKTISAPPPMPEVPNISSPTPKGNKYGVAKINLGAMVKEAASMSSSDNQPTQVESVSLEQVQHAWNNYAQSVDNDGTRNILNNAELKINGNVLDILVGSKLAMNTIKLERELVMELRRKLYFNALTITVNFDKTKAPKEVAKPKKLLNVKEKFIKMREVNPLIHQLATSFGLKPDE